MLCNAKALSIPEQQHNICLLMINFISHVCTVVMHVLEAFHVRA